MLRPPSSGASALELDGRRLAFVWSYQGTSEGPTHELRVDTVGGGHRRLDRQTLDKLTYVIVSWPCFDAGRLFLDARACVGDRRGCTGRARLVRSTYVPPIKTQAAVDPRPLISYERDKGTSSFLLGGPIGCQGEPHKPRTNLPDHDNPAALLPAGTKSPEGGTHPVMT